MGKNAVPGFNERVNTQFKQPRRLARDVLWGVVALVDVDSETRALTLKSELEDLGATVVSSWSPIVTHLIWSQGGSRSMRSRALSLACHVVSPLWVKACTASSSRISEKSFRSATRDSDLPSPATLRGLLETAEKENWVPSRLLCDKENSSHGRPPRLRISSDTDENTTSKTADRNTTHDSIDVASRINTAPRRALPASLSPLPLEPKSRRKLFTTRADMDKDDSDKQNTDTPRVAKTTTCPVVRITHKKVQSRIKPARVDRAPERQNKSKKYNLTQEKDKNLRTAQRIAKKLASVQTPKRRIKSTQTQLWRDSNVPKIVLSGMPKSQKQAVVSAIRALNGKIQKYVDHHTTHVLLGRCREDTADVNAEDVQANEQKDDEVAADKNIQRNNRSNNRHVLSSHNKCASPATVLTEMHNDNVEGAGQCSAGSVECDAGADIINDAVDDDDADNNDNRQNTSDLCEGIVNDKSLRTVKTLLGAVRGCRVLHAQWALHSQKEGKWLPHYGYELTYLWRVSQTARAERSAFGKMHKEYVFKIFQTLRVFVSEAAEKRDAALEILSVCGAQIVNDIPSTPGVSSTAQYNQIRNSGITQSASERMVRTGENYDLIRIGVGPDEVSSKWVFDSVAAGRPRATRKYINRIFST